MRKKSNSASVPRSSLIQPSSTDCFCYLMLDGAGSAVVDRYGVGDPLTVAGTLTGIWASNEGVTLSGNNFWDSGNYASEESWSTDVFTRVGRLDDIEDKHIILAFNEYLAGDPATGAHIINFGRTTLNGVGGWRVLINTAGILNVIYMVGDGAASSVTLGFADTTSLRPGWVRHLLEIEAYSDPGVVTINHYMNGQLEDSESAMTLAQASTIGKTWIPSGATNNQWRNVLFGRAGSGTAVDLIHPGGVVSRVLGYKGAYQSGLAYKLARELNSYPYAPPSKLYGAS